MNFMNKKNYLNVYLGSLKEEWLNYCTSLGKKPGAAIKEAIEAQLSQPSKKSKSTKPIFKQIRETPDTGPKARIEVRLTTSEKEKLVELAALENCSPQIWITNVLRATLTHQPQCGMREIEALGESNYHLLAIGRNLNQIAKKLNYGLPSSVTVEKIQLLRKLIENHTTQVSNTLRASVERWRIE
jgi:hypothetical protein